MVYVPTDWVDGSTPLNRSNMKKIEDELVLLDSGVATKQKAVAVGTIPPASPADGDLWALPVDVPTGTTWLFRYNAGSASAYKWQFVGGPPFHWMPGDWTTTGQGAWQIGGTGFYLPRPGDYLAEITVEVIPAGAAQSSQYIAVCIDGAQPAIRHGVTTFAMGSPVSIHSRAHFLGASNGQQLNRGMYSAAVTATFTNMFLTVLPIRVS